MLLIADSGSTKCDWIIVEKNGVTSHYNTVGLNPFFFDSKRVAETLGQHESFIKEAKNVEHLYFYGAGISSPMLKAEMSNNLAPVFPNAKIETAHDLLGAALATYENVPGISCILGTGSNSCYYDGENVIEKVPALGYVLGDEGSGAYFGKILLRNYLYGKLPLDIASKFESRYSTSKDDILKSVYSSPNPNTYLASFMPLISELKDHKFVKNMIFDGMMAFLEYHVCCYENFWEVKTHFIGSIAYFHQEEVLKACLGLGVKPGNFIRKPIHGLVNYHTEDILGIRVELPTF